MFSEETSLCEVCGAISKYKCPRCELRSCSVGCSRLHKERTGCNGERDKTAYIPMKDYKHMHLVNDFTLLEEKKRLVEELGKGASKSIHPNQQQRQHYKTNELIRTYANEGVELLLSPQGMERRRKDHTFFDTRAGELKMTCDIVEGDNIRVVHQVLQSMTIQSILKQKLNMDDISCLHTYIKSQDGRNIKAEHSEEIIETLRGTTVIDYPVLVLSSTPLDKRWRTEEHMKFDNDSDDSDSSISSSSSSDSDSSDSDLSGIADDADITIDIN